MDISIKNVPPEKVERLRLRAKQNHRSLQGELLALMDQAVEGHPRQLTIEEVAVSVAALALKRKDEAAKLIRRDGDR